METAIQVLRLVLSGTLARYPRLYQRKRAGADIYIMGFHDFEDWESNVIKSVIESFFVAIHEGKLIVKVGGTTVNDT